MEFRLMKIYFIHLSKETLYSGILSDNCIKHHQSCYHQQSYHHWFPRDWKVAIPHVPLMDIRQERKASSFHLQSEQHLLWLFQMPLIICLLISTMHIGTITSATFISILQNSRIRTYSFGIHYITTNWHIINRRLNSKQILPVPEDKMCLSW